VPTRPSRPPRPRGAATASQELRSASPEPRPASPELRPASPELRPASPDLRSAKPESPTVPTPGRSVASRRALTDLVRAATLGSYGVTGFAGNTAAGRITRALGLPPRGIRIGLGDELTVDLDLVVAPGLPIAEVARQVDSAVRYTIRRALGREVSRLTIHVDGLRADRFPSEPVPPSTVAGSGPDGMAIAPDDLAASGTDVA
jgi:uncharacterized alkaline shock family protein YloU